MHSLSDQTSKSFLIDFSFLWISPISLASFQDSITLIPLLLSSTVCYTFWSKVPRKLGGLHSDLMSSPCIINAFSIYFSVFEYIVWMLYWQLGSSFCLYIIYVRTFSLTCWLALYFKGKLNSRIPLAHFYSEYISMPQNWEYEIPTTSLFPFYFWKPTEHQLHLSSYSGLDLAYFQLGFLFLVT